MTHQFLLLATLAYSAMVSATTAYAQPRTGWAMEATALAAHQGEGDLSGGGDVSSTRTFLGVGGLYRTDEGVVAGLSIGLGQQSYVFGSAAVPLWGNVRAISLSLPMRFQLGQSSDLIVVPQVRRAYESGASASDSTTYGVFAGLSWLVSETLRIGPGFGAFSKIEGSRTEVFPILIVDWQISDRWNFSTGRGIAATRGPGLRLTYAYSDALDIGLGVRLERSEFRLNQTGIAPGGVGEDSNVPIVLSLDYNPNPGVSVSGFIGAAIDGELTIEGSNGMTIDKQSYDTTPVAGLAMRLRF